MAEPLDTKPIEPDRGPAAAARARVDAQLTVESYAQLLRAEADEILAARGVAVRVRTMHRIGEIEAA